MILNCLKMLTSTHITLLSHHYMPKVFFKMLILDQSGTLVSGICYHVRPRRIRHWKYELINELYMYVVCHKSLSQSYVIFLYGINLYSVNISPGKWDKLKSKVVFKFLGIVQNIACIDLIWKKNLWLLQKCIQYISLT